MSPDKHFGSGTRAGARRGLQNRRAAWKTWGWWVRFPCASAIFCSVKDGARSQGFFGTLGTYATLGRRAVMSRSGAYLVGGVGPGRRGRARSAGARDPRRTTSEFPIPTLGLLHRLGDQLVRLFGISLTLQQSGQHQRRDDRCIRLDHEHRRLLGQLVPGDLFIGSCPRV